MELPGGIAELLQVNQDGLLAEAGWCESVAGRLAADSAPTATGASVLASSAAVDAAHADEERKLLVLALNEYGGTRNIPIG